MQQYIIPNTLGAALMIIPVTFDHYTPLLVLYQAISVITPTAGSSPEKDPRRSQTCIICRRSSREPVPSHPLYLSAFRFSNPLNHRHSRSSPRRRGQRYLSHRKSTETKSSLILNTGAVNHICHPDAESLISMLSSRHLHCSSMLSFHPIRSWLGSRDPNLPSARLCKNGFPDFLTRREAHALLFRLEL